MAARQTQEALRQARVVDTEKSGVAAAVLLWRVLFCEAQKQKVGMVPLLTSGADIEINGRSLVPANVRSALAEWEGVNTAVSSGVPWRIEIPDFETGDFKIGVGLPKYDEATVMGNLRHLLGGFTAASDELVEAQRLIAAANFSRERRNDAIVPEITSRALPVNVDEIARILRLNRGSFTIDRIANGGFREGCLKVGRVYVTSVFPVVRPDSFAAPEQEWWRELGFESLQDWIRRDPLLIQVDTAGLENHIVVDMYEAFNLAMAHAVRSMVSVMASAQVNNHLGRVLEGRNTDFSQLWENQRKDLQAALSVLLAGANLVRSRLDVLVNVEKELNGDDRVALFPQELATIAAAMRSLFWKMETVADGARFTSVADNERGMNVVLARFKHDIRELSR